MSRWGGPGAAACCATQIAGRPEAAGRHTARARPCLRLVGRMFAACCVRLESLCVCLKSRREADLAMCADIMNAVVANRGPMPRRSIRRAVQSAIRYACLDLAPCSPPDEQRRPKRLRGSTLLPEPRCAARRGAALRDQLRAA